MSASSTATDNRFDTDVLVVGAGPVGLTTACALRHHGVDCRILEERTGVKHNSRANNLWARPQELLASIGIRDALAAKSYGIRQVATMLNGQPTDPLLVDRVASPYPRVLYSGQDVIETTLSQTLADKGTAVERGCKVTGFEQDEDGVTVTVEREEGGPERVRCRYLVAADGANSTVRSVVGLDFEKERFEERMNRQVDAKLSWRRSTEPDQLWFFYYKDGFCGVLPVWEGYHRLFFLQDDTGVPDRDPTLEEIQALGREVTGDETLTLTDPIWFSHSRFQHGVASAFARGRVFLAGDAGHLSLPIGGQGMNAGLHDAVEIAWRLAMTLAGRAEPVVLASYDNERQGEHARLDGQQATGFRRTVYRGPISDGVLSLGAKALPSIGSLLQGTDDLQQISVSYPNSPLNDDQLSGFAHFIRASGPRPGERAPDAEVTQDGRATTLFSSIYNPDGRSWGWALLAFDGRSSEAGLPLLKAVDAVAAWDCVRPRLVLAGPLVEAGAVPILSDLDGRPPPHS
ncbi:FAD-dependent monooxygenase [Muricoccus vinaceus]|uniref:FAD-dependent monooxygenase n=1 Tax=Muricoccus vinaceus TaxID=424704 RepID=A0ABV6IWZ4_9PROT